MADKLNYFKEGTSGTTITTSNSASAGDDPTSDIGEPDDPTGT